MNGVNNLVTRPPAENSHPPAFNAAEGYDGGWMNPLANPKLAGAMLFIPFRKGRGMAHTDDEKRAFRKRVAKRRARKGYR